MNNIRQSGISPKKLVGCDYAYPQRGIRVERIGALSVGDTTEIKINYPSALRIFGWGDENIEILDGEDVIAVSDLTIVALVPGTAQIRVNATATVLVSEGTDPHRVYEEWIYYVELYVTVR